LARLDGQTVSSVSEGAAWARRKAFLAAQTPAAAFPSVAGDHSVSLCWQSRC
jgi:hypothetical protein